MKWLGKPSPFHLFTNPCLINRFIFCQGVVIYYFFFKKTCLITQSKLLISVYLRICINDIAICTKVSLFTDLVGMETFGTSIDLENHTVYFVENYMIVNLKYCIIRFYMFYFFKCSVNISFQNISLSS